MHVYRIQQKLVSHPLADVAGEVHRQLSALDLDLPQGEVAVTAGSRGIAHIVEITRAAGDWLRERGARPFLVPCMGSHNGATAEGQRAMVESLGLSPDATGMEIRSAMDIVKLGTVTTGDVFMDRHCYEAAGVLVLNRIKLHTAFSGPVQSGLVKMMVVGMGKIDSARTFHSLRSARMRDGLLEMGQLVIQSGKILAGLAILEDGFDETAELHALRPEEILEREPELLERYRHYFPALPSPDINVLIVGQIGKDLSGTGMDTNVIGRRGIRDAEDLKEPRIGVIGALSLSERSAGNAIGIGLADFVTRRLREAMDERKTLVNVLTTGAMERFKIPATLGTDEALIETITTRFGTARWMFIANTLHLGTLYATEDLAQELREHPACDVDPSPVALTFRDGILQLSFS